jgi:hypothetical protein
VRAGVDAEGTRMAIVRVAAWMDQRRAGRDGTMERVLKTCCGRAGSEESSVARGGLVWRWIGHGWWAMVSADLSVVVGLVGGRADRVPRL